MTEQRMSGGQAVLEVLRRNGITYTFCVPGESFLGLLDAYYDAPDMKLVATRHESGAAFMAEGYAKLTGKPAVCMGTRGVGTTNMMIGIHTAHQDSTPLIAIAGQVNRDFLQREAWQEIDLVAMCRPLTKWAVEVTLPERLPELVQKAIRIAISGRPGPVFISLPQDVLNAQITAAFPPPAVAPRPRPSAMDIERILDALLAARRPAILAGVGVLRAKASDALVAFAEMTGIPVCATWRRMDLFPNDHPLYLGPTGLGVPATVPARLQEADVLLVIGTRLDEIGSQNYTLPSANSAFIHIAADPEGIGGHRGADIGVVADAGLALADLLAAAHERPAQLHAIRTEREAANRRDRQAYVNASTPRRIEHATPIHPEGIIYDLQRLLPPETKLVLDVGAFTGWIPRYFRFNTPGSFIGTITAGMGYGLPAAIGAALAEPGVPVVNLAGDGSFMMTMAELETAVRLGTRIITIVFDNAMYGTIRLHQEMHYPGRVVGTDLTTPDLARTAESFGALGITVRDNAEFEAALCRALQADRPSVIHLLIDPDQIFVGRRLSTMHQS